MKRRMIPMFLTVFLFISTPSVYAESETTNTAASLPEQQVESLKSIRHFQIEVLPIAMIYGIFGGDLGFRLTSKWSLHGSGQWGQNTTGKTERTITEFMANGQYHLNSEFGSSGWSVAAGAGAIRSVRRAVTSERTLFETNMIYDWIGGSWFLASLGFGLVYQDGSDTQRFQPDLIFRFGILL